ncbi:DUF4751 family protein [Citrobacter sp. Igbk 16]|uniref:DUF4751 family protein n=1 Tax=Citrobacter sp. Igbk 16 TaxID=2963958 RepID=UPI0023049720|nr:DUF4751 family protein [Citrobacter sp. Igbk 16]MDA8517877.1 DUF4751 family protein [Citrobacter sp. Igbk 16]
MEFRTKEKNAAKYKNYMFVNTLLADNNVKTVSKYIAYKTWDGQFWCADVTEDGNAFFHYKAGDRKNGHHDTVINYLLNGQKWQATITNYEFFHCLDGEKNLGHHDCVIDYISVDNRVYQGSFAEYYSE